MCCIERNKRLSQDDKSGENSICGLTSYLVPVCFSVYAAETDDGKQ